MSSRKTSLSGLRPVLVTSPSIMNVDPALGPCFTSRRACPALSSSSGKGKSSEPSASISTGLRARVVSSCRTAPQFAQKRASSLFGCPHRVQYTLDPPLPSTHLDGGVSRLNLDLETRSKLPPYPRRVNRTRSLLEGTSTVRSLDQVQRSMGARPKRRGSAGGRVHHRPGATCGVGPVNLEEALVQPRWAVEGG